MKEVKLKISKADVFEEVAKTTAYIGHKRTDADPKAYDRIFATDADRQMLERYWREACSIATATLKPFATAIAEQPCATDADTTRDYTATLSMGNAYDGTLTDSIAASLFSFFTAYVVAAWCRTACKEEAEGYATDAAAFTDNVERKLHHRMPPTRKTGNQ